MPNKIPHISVCICTFKRPELLKCLLTELLKQSTESAFTFSVIVADNDRLQSAREIVVEFTTSSRIPVIYAVESEQNIAMARNKALEYASGDYIAFIDDDEIPDKSWLRDLLETCESEGVDGVLGPVLPVFRHEPPQWIIRGGFFSRPSYPTGYRLDWRETRTGNVLIRRSILKGMVPVFRPEFGTGGEDVDFFRRVMLQGNVFLWCNEAIVRELVPQSRCSSGYLLRRALLRGSNFPKRQVNRLRTLTKSFVAIPLYVLALPFLAFFGRHIFIRYLVKLCDHVSRVFAYLGVQLAHEKEM